MLKYTINFLFTLALILLPLKVTASDWQLDNDSSRLSFGSIKKASVGESNYFSDLKGGVNAEGKATIQIELASVQTGIDIRNDRLKEHVFKIASWPQASLAMDVDMASLSNLKSGEVKILEDVDTSVSIAGVESEITSSVVVTRLSPTRIMVQPDLLVMLDAEEFNLEGGVEILREIMELSSISTAIPVSYRFVFEQIK
ncbi:YceI family protein [Kiloniella sp. EL199]|uniref:YceI family protein n=1 Tax=Kiloniella sp. EL199 TaxID=2107581 RepID=UPI000EA2C2FE|nr:YceI family protein [Kiloniella sp. EL199]